MRIGIFELVNPPPGHAEIIEKAVAACTFPWELLAAKVAKDPDKAMITDSEKKKFDSKGSALGVSNCGWAWNADFADFDADAKQDLYVTNGYFTGVQPKDC